MKINPRVAVYSRAGLHVFTALEGQARNLIAGGRATVKLKRRKFVMAIELVDTISAHIIKPPTPITLAALTGQRYTRRIVSPTGGAYQEFKHIDARDRSIFCMSVTDNLRLS